MRHEHYTLSKGFKGSDRFFYELKFQQLTSGLLKVSLKAVSGQVNIGRILYLKSKLRKGVRRVIIFNFPIGFYTKTDPIPQWPPWTEQICQGLNAIEMHAVYDHKVSSLINVYQNTHNSDEY